MFTTEDLQQYENEINNPTVKNVWMEGGTRRLVLQERGAKKKKKNEKQTLGMISLVPAVEHSLIFLVEM